MSRGFLTSNQVVGGNISQSRNLQEMYKPIRDDPTIQWNFHLRLKQVTVDPDALACLLA